MGLLLFTTCFPLYIFVSANTEWTISAGRPIFLSIVSWWLGSLTPSLVIVWPQQSMIFSRLVWPTFGWARQGLWQEGGWQLVGWDGLLCKGICFGEVFLLDEDLLRLSEIFWRWATRDWSVTKEGRAFLFLCWCIAHLLVYLCFCIFVVPYLNFLVCVFVFMHLCIQDWSVVGRWSYSSPPLCAGGICKPALIPKVLLLHS